MILSYNHMPTPMARAYQNGQADTHGQTPERAVSDGSGVPCRHCLRQVPAGEEFLILAYRPFETLHPYAETGPVFLCAAECPAPDVSRFPEVLKSAPEYLLKGYTKDERIKYGTGAVTPSDDIPARAAALLKNPEIAFVDVRSARNNCWQVRIRRDANAA